MQAREARRDNGLRTALIGITAALALAGCGDDDSPDHTRVGNPGGGSSPTANNIPGRNGAPVISGEPSASANPGDTYFFSPAVSDADGDRLSFTIYNQPDWAEFDPETGVLTGTPTVDDAGHYPNVIIRVSDGYTSSQLWPFSIDVLPDGTTTAFLTWVPPTEYEDGSPLNELAGYRVRYGVESGDYSELVDIADPFTTVLDLDFLESDTYYFVITAYNYLGAESDFSNEETLALN